MKHISSRPNQIRAWREKRGLSQQALAERIEIMTGEAVDYTTIGRLERGKLNYTKPMLEVIALALGVDVDDLISDFGPDDGLRELKIIISKLNIQKRAAAIAVLKALQDDAA